MPPRQRMCVLRRVILGAVMSGTVSCLDITGADPGGGLASISVTEGKSVRVGDTVRLSATGTWDGFLALLYYDPVRDARWSVSDAGIATLETPAPPAPDDTTWTARILVRGKRPGAVTVFAQARDVSGSAVVTVIP